MTREREVSSTTIVKNESGATVFGGTRILISHIINRAQAVGNIEEAEREFVDGYPSLTRDHFQAAIDYYEANKEEVNGEIGKVRQLRALLERHAEPTKGLVDFEAVTKDPDYHRLTSS